VKIHEHDLQAILQEVLSPSSATEVREHLIKAYSVDGDRIEISNLSEAHIKCCVDCSKGPLDAKRERSFRFSDSPLQNRIDSFMVIVAV